MTADRTDSTAGAQDRVDVVVIGGGPAGLAGAVVLARARRRVVVIDSGEPRNRRAAGVHGYLGCDGVTPAEFLGTGRQELARYSGTFRPGTVQDAMPTAIGDIVVRLADGEQLTTRRLLIATGLTDELPPIPGIVERFGRDVLHCPYCHGWEVRDRAIGVLGTGPWATHLAQLLRQWSADVVLLLHSAPLPEPDQAAGLAARGIPVARSPVVQVEIADDRLTGVRLADGRFLARDVLFCSPVVSARTAGLTGLGLAVAEDPRGFGTTIATDTAGRTGVPNVWAAGNVRDVQAQVGTSVADGAAVAAAINADLVADDVRRAIADH